MAYYSSVSINALPFPVPQDLLLSALVSTNYEETLKNADQFLEIKDYSTAAALYTAAAECLQVPKSAERVANILCKRAECLLRLNYAQHVLQDCNACETLTGCGNEHVAFLRLRALELQGEVQKAFIHAIVFEVLNPKKSRDKDAVRRLRTKVKSLFGQGEHQVYRTFDILMRQGMMFFENDKTDLALSIFTEVVNLAPKAEGIQMAHEYRARCYFIQDKLLQAAQDCNRALNLSDGKSIEALHTKIEIQVKCGEFSNALELLNEWRTLHDPELQNTDLDMIKRRIRDKMAGDKQTSGISRAQLSIDLWCSQEVQPNRGNKRPQYRASKHVTTSKNKKELQREEWIREKERQEIAQTLIRNTPKKGNENRDKAARADFHPQEKRSETKGESLDISPTGRKKKKKKRGKNRRRADDGDESDTDSVCSTRTCPDSLDCTISTVQSPSKLRSIGRLSSKGKHQQQKPSPVVQRPPLAPARSVTNKPVAQVKPFTEGVSKAGTSMGATGNGIRKRPRLVFGAYRLCKYYRLQQPCFQGERCSYAHSEEERKAWEAERKRDNYTVKTTNKEFMTKTPYLSLDQWRQAFKGPGRGPLRMPPKGGRFRICAGWTKRICKLGKGCTFAHGPQELEAWNKHAELMEQKMENKIEEEKENEKKNEGDETATKTITHSPIKDDRPVPTYKLKDLVTRLPGVSVACEPSPQNVSLQVPLDSEGEKTYNWTVRLSYESSETGHLQDIALLWKFPNCYSFSSVNFKCSKGPVTLGNAVEKIDDRHYQVPSYLREFDSDCEMEVALSFSTFVFGNFRQYVVFDFGQERHLALEFCVEIGSQEFLKEFCEEKTKLALGGPFWDDNCRTIVPFEFKIPSLFKNDYLTDRYKLPLDRVDDVVPCPLLDESQGLSEKNYRDIMHQLLFVEEFYIRKQVARFNMQGANLHAASLIVKKDEVLSAEEGWLYGSFYVLRPITPDDADGRLLLRNLFGSAGSVLIVKRQCSQSVVYEALVDSVEESRVIVKLSVQCCADLGLTNNSDTIVDVQFRISRLTLCEMHDNIDRLGLEHIRVVFPAFGRVALEKNLTILPWILDPRLNDDQKEIIKKIASPSSNSPPLVVFGPFGTGKTFTLNQAVRQIALDCNNRVLICTHSNSAADIHVELLDEYLRNNGMLACRPLRIYTPLRKLSTVSATVKEYCLVTGGAFRLPTRNDVICHRVIITTLGMSRALFYLDLHRGIFSHILIDEAAQALETETLAPITLAGNNTKVVFTGDHMQMSPDVLSPQAKKWGFQMSLQERLFYDYDRRRNETTQDPNVIYLTTNYRSNEQILQFSSDMFYGKLSCGSNQPLHPWLGPLVFYSAFGEEEMAENHSSYRNLAEVNEVVKRVKELVDCWPQQWGSTPDPKQVAVVSSERYQVKTIRDGLRKIGLGEVDVETIENVQGKQFRALFVSTVRTTPTCNEFKGYLDNEIVRPYLSFLSDPKLLNTALTRAQSLIAVVGDPFSLRTIGDCQGLWEEFIKRCSDSGNLFGIERSELEESISQMGLNVNANEFVPRFSSHTSPQPISETSNHQMAALDDVTCNVSHSTPQLNAPEHTTDDENSSPKEMTHENVPTTGIGKILEDCAEDSKYYQLKTTSQNEEDDSEVESISDSGEMCDRSIGSDDIENGDFVEGGNVPDETVPPKYMDDITLAIEAKCVENEKKRKLKEEKIQQLEREQMRFFASTNYKATKDIGNESVHSAFASNNARTDLRHKDFIVVTRKGKTQIVLSNPRIEYSERTKRLISQAGFDDHESLQAECLERLLKEEPEKYRRCRLRISFGKSRVSYGEIQDLESEDILIDRRSTRQRFDGDIVAVELKKESSDKSSVVLERIMGKIKGRLHCPINPRERQFVCTISRDNPWLLLPIDKSMTPIANLKDSSCKGIPIYNRVQPEERERAVWIKEISRKDAFSGKFLFVVQYLQWRKDFPYPLGIATKTIRKGSDLSSAYHLLETEYQLKKSFTNEVSREAAKFQDEWQAVLEREKQQRRPVLNAFTIDPPGSKALDDALTVEKLSNGLCRVGVHIADVSYFVRKGSGIDLEARKRGTSYFPGHSHRDFLMLPRELSHVLCSLLPNEERLAVSLYWDLDQKGHIHGVEDLNYDGRVQGRELNFTRTIVKSQCRLTYTQAQAIITGQDSVPQNRDSDGEVTTEIKESIVMLSRLAQNRRKLRLRGGSFDRFDDANRAEDFEAHELVEEMMILANESVARYLIGQRNEESLPLRIQLPPKTHKLSEWQEKFGDCAKLSLSLREYSRRDQHCVETFILPKYTWSEISSARQKNNVRRLTNLICNDHIYPQLAIARSFFRGLQRRAEDLRAAEVPSDNRVHWSLKLQEYTRFTSPIRRYLDIEVHRLLLRIADQNTEEEISVLFRRCSFLSERANRFEKECGRIQFAASLRKEGCETPAVIEVFTRDSIQLQPLSEANSYLPSGQKRIQISHLGPIEQPEMDGSLQCLEVKWKLRIYGASSETINQALECETQEQREKHFRKDRTKIALDVSSDNSSFLHYSIPNHLWLNVLNAIDNNKENLEKCLADIDAEIKKIEVQTKDVNFNYENCNNKVENDNHVHVDNEHGKDDDDNDDNDEDDEDVDNDEDNDDDDDVEDDDDDDSDDDDNDDEGDDDDDEEHDYDDESDEDDEDDSDMHFQKVSLMLKVSDTVNIQLAVDDVRGLMSPEIQLFKLAPGIDVCLEHRKRPDRCFVELASDHSSQPKYKSIAKYIKAWEPVLAMEAATQAITNDDVIILQNLTVKWRKAGEKTIGDFLLEKSFCRPRCIEISGGDYACVKVRCPVSVQAGRSDTSKSITATRLCKTKIEVEEEAYSDSDDDSSFHTASEGEDDKEGSTSDGKKGKDFVWVGHCSITKEKDHVKLHLKQHSLNIPPGLLVGEGHICTLEIIKQAINHRRMMKALTNLEEKGMDDLVHDICLGKKGQLGETSRKQPPSQNLSIVGLRRDQPLAGEKASDLNSVQLVAVKKALRGRFTLIQGPPGTGKTITGVHIAYWFGVINEDDKNENATVLYCGPSNRSVDVVAEYLMKIKGLESKILRVYGKVIEQKRFPIPGEVKSSRTIGSKEEMKVPKNLRDIALHHVIRDTEKSTFADELSGFEGMFTLMKQNKQKVDDEVVEKYRQLIKEAEQWAIKKFGRIVLCTCSAAGSKRMEQVCENVIQCIVDECGMCLEPETLIPIVSSGSVRQVVLIGDHMQLQPIVKNRVAKSLGLSTSMFERYASRAIMLKEQYRMHPDICEFPSKQFYSGKLVTSKCVTDRPSWTAYGRDFLNFWPSHTGNNYTPLVFCHVIGEEEELVVTTEEGNQRSKSNMKEKDKVVAVVKKLLGIGVNSKKNGDSKVRQDQILVLSPYRAQCHVIRQDLIHEGVSNVNVTSIVKSQGSENEFVIISLVRSLPDSQIEYEPTGAWLRENLGFVTDEHQINVALTRAKQGLCIIGNRNLLEICDLWSSLIEHYQSKSCVVEGMDWP